jgi:hypothetical protein
MSTPADRYIEVFQRGEEFQGPSTGLVVGGKPHPASGRIMQGQAEPSSLVRLADELGTGSAFVRQNIVALLVDVGLQTDPGRPDGTEALRDPRIIEILVQPGFSKRDAAREAAMEALRKLARPADLVQHAGAIARALEEKPTEDALLLVAKAKAVAAKPFVETLAPTPSWNGNVAARITLAALGDKAVEAEFVRSAAEAHTARDSQMFMDALGPLAMIGTRTSLIAIAGYLRTPLTFLVPNALEKSLRLNVLDALRYDYPDNPLFYENNIHSDREYEAAEKFCEAEFGISYGDPRPPFMTYRPFPVPLSP